MRFLVTLIFIIFAHNVSAEKKGEFTGYKLPRFVSLKSDNVNLRVGPSENYPIKLKYITQNFPVEIIDEYDVWRQVRDLNDKVGWIHKSLLKGDRYIIIKSKNNVKYNLHNYPNGKKIGLIKKNNIVELKKCLKDWCLIKHKKIKGWILKKHLWGVYTDEKYNIGYMHFFIELYWKFINLKFF